MLTLALICPGLFFLLRGKPLQAVLSLILQCTLLGWLPATVWALDFYTKTKYILAKQRVMAAKAAANRVSHAGSQRFPMRMSVPPLIDKIPVLPIGLRPTDS